MLCNLITEKTDIFDFGEFLRMIFDNRDDYIVALVVLKGFWNM